MANERIMVVEDLPVIGLDIANRLEGLGYVASPVVPSGEEAINWAEETQPDLVLMDIKLKGNMDGIEATEQIRKRFNIPVVYVTAYADEQTLQRAKVTEPFGYLLKPFEDRELRAAIEIALYRHKMQTRLEALKTLGQQISASLSLEVAVQSALDQITETIGVSFAVLFLRDGKRLIPKGYSPKDIQRLNEKISMHRVGECLCGLSVSQRKPVYSKDIRKDQRCTLEECKDAGLRSFAAVPLKSADTIIGVLGIASEAERDFEEEASFLEAISNQVVIGIRNSLLYERVQSDASKRKQRLAGLKRAEEEKSKLEAQLLHAQKMDAIGTLAGGIAHDFNNALSAIIGYSELSMADVPEASQLHANLQQTLSAGHRAKDLVKYIIDFGRQTDQIRKPLRIDLIIKDDLKMLRSSLPTTIQIRQNILAETDRALSDPSQIHQVLINLCTNASHSMREKGGLLEVNLTKKELDADFTACHPGIDPGSYLKLSVRDTGEGMTPDVMQQIFDPHFTTKKKSEKAGLGLAIVHGIVQSHGGTITVHSEPGKGSIFEVYLPCIEEEIERAEDDMTHPVPIGHERILFIDDEQTLVDLGKQMLERLGYEVVTRTNSIEALKLFKEESERFDLVVTDMTMPKMTGDKLAKEFMKIRSDIPVILCTGYSELISEEKAKGIGIREFIMKPLAIRELAIIVRKVLDEK